MGALHGVLQVPMESLGPIDFNVSPYSATLNAELTNVMNDNLARVMARYYNEMGFSHRMLDLAVHFGSR